jgi:nucleoside-triphosphatase
VNMDTLNDLAIPAIHSAIASNDLVIIDEFAPMELVSPDFIPAVEAALASDKPLIIATHATLNHPLVHRIRQELKLYRVKLSNRDRLVTEVCDYLMATDHDTLSH